MFNTIVTGKQGEVGDVTAYDNGTPRGFSGKGGDAFNGVGGNSIITGSGGATNGNNGTNGGGGSGAGVYNNQTNRTGGNGGGGIVVIYEYA